VAHLREMLRDCVNSIAKREQELAAEASRVKRVRLQGCIGHLTDLAHWIVTQRGY
jgi:hypothetical protein